MRHYRVLQSFLVVLIIVITGCAAPTTVNVRLLETSFKVKDRIVIPEFKTRNTLATIATDDWSRVEGLANITGNRDARLQMGKPAASPTQNRIVFFEVVGEKGAIFSQSLSSRARTSVASDSTLNLSPTFTPDGNFLIFSSDRSGDGQNLWRIRADGAGGITQITASSSFDVEPSMAADGETIIFQSHRQNNVNPFIWSVNMNGGLLTQLSPGSSPSVSPDGRRVAYVRSDPRTGRKQIWLMQVDGSGQTQLSSGNAEDIDPSWHPGGKFIVYASNQAGTRNGNYDIWLMRADGTNRTQATSNGSRDDAPVFDRQGRTIIFRSNRGGAWNLFRFTPALKGNLQDQR